MIYESSNAFTFPHASKALEKVLINPEQLKTPTVGKYTENIIQKPKGGFHFGKEEKLKQKRPKTPGPGQYDTKNDIFGQCTPKFSMGKKLNNMNIYMKKKIPGPGTYNLTESNYEKTIGKRKTLGYFSKVPKLKIKNNKVPGVGKYELTYYNFGNSQKNKFTIPKSARKMELKKEIDVNKDKNTKDNKINIGKQSIKRKKNHKYDSIKSRFHDEGTKPILKGKSKDLKRFNTPGPGKYDIEKAEKKIMKKIPATSFGYGKKIDFEEIAKKNNVPGPKYNINSQFNISDTNKVHAIKYYKSNKKNNERYQTPGPGSYYIPCSFANTPYYQSIDNKYRKI